MNISDPIADMLTRIRNASRARHDEVIVPAPYWVSSPDMVKLADGLPAILSCGAEHDYKITAKQLHNSLNENSRMVILNSPSNPTGNLLSKARMQAIAGMDPWIVSDEIYHGLVYEGKEHSIFEFSDHAFVVNGFSKLFAMTGLRLGYVIAPKEFIRPMQKLHQNFFISANAMVQQAGIAALKEAGGDVTRMKAIYDERRRFMISRLKAIGFGITVEPTGAFYVFANARHISEDSYKLAFDILEKARVGVAPGIDLGPNGEGSLRFFYANSLENIKEGMHRLEKYLADRR